MCSDDALPADRIPDLVARLVERSILKRRDGPRGGRFRILEPLRQFGRERLEESGELTVMLRRHRDWIRTLAVLAGATDSRQLEAIERIRTERANVWSALDFCRSTPSEAEVGAAIVGDLWIFWLSQGPATDVDRLIARSPRARPHEQPRPRNTPVGWRPPPVPAGGQGPGRADGCRGDRGGPQDRRSQHRLLVDADARRRRVPRRAVGRRHRDRGRVAGPGYGHGLGLREVVWRPCAS